MSYDKDNNRNRKDNNPQNPDRKEVNPANMNWESSRNPDSDNDRKGRNVDIDQENKKNQMSGREQETTPLNRAKDIVDRFNREDDQQKKDR
ncbi:hypothetical protein [Nafulsella turpanensis]|uniref:hypothetical protein n=1 Tax=Nafulsella turpanensis TaxID=1265690 RepID=UPI00034A985B|nr:hypothetical protein [Nafulsella turpanensis]